jgi:hypothetical protein
VINQRISRRRSARNRMFRKGAPAPLTAACLLS